MAFNLHTPISVTLKEKTMEIIRKLTEEQKKQAISLFLIGECPYTEIARQLKVPYQAVNSFMTIWKKENGLIKKRKRRSDAKRHKPHIIVKSEDSTEYSQVLTMAILEELTFLRKFYLTYRIKNKEAA